MFYIISIPSISPVTVSQHDSKEAFIAHVFANYDSATDPEMSFGEAKDIFGRDLHGFLFIENEADKTNALNYPATSHKWAEVRRMAQSINL